MSCIHGRVSPTTTTKLRLFADSGGYCANPECLTEIFHEFVDEVIHIGEIAHVISAGGQGPRSDNALTPEQKGQYENLILLCPTCHTIIDKAEQQYPVETILEWKRHHKEKVKKAFGVRSYNSREEVRSVLEPLFLENSVMFQEYGPLTDERFNPESTLPEQWLRKIRSKVIPNNRKVVGLCEENSNFLTQEEKVLFEKFRQHVDDFEAKHLAGAEENGRQFPNGFDSVFKVEFK